jgi:hypothetical protein
MLLVPFVLGILEVMDRLYMGMCASIYHTSFAQLLFGYNVLVERSSSVYSFPYSISLAILQ